MPESVTETGAVASGADMATLRARQRVAEGLSDAAKRLMDRPAKNRQYGVGGVVVGPDASPLIGLKSACDAVLEGYCDSLTALVAFTVSTYVGDVSLNLFVDTRYSPTLERARVELISQSSTTFGALADALLMQNRIAASDSLGELVLYYSQLLGRLSDAEEARYGHG